jgi:pyrroline-5-carboxylate reductase
MGEALVGGLLDAQPPRDPGTLAIAEVDPERRRVLAERFPGVRVVPAASWAVADADVVVVAVKPADVAAVLSDASEALGERTLVISIAAGVTTAAVEGAVPGRPVVRAMPNTPALVGRGASAIAAGSLASDADLATAEQILGAVGIVVRVPEIQIDAVTGLSGSGPAYIFHVAEALIEAGESAGLDHDVAAELTYQTILGAATMLVETGESPEALRAMVTSPGGTTAAGHARLEAAEIRAAFVEAVAAATERSRELGR